MSLQVEAVVVKRWQGNQHPSVSTITRTMRDEALRPYGWNSRPNHRFAIRSHNFIKVLYIISGIVEIQLPDDNQRIILRAGDRINIPAGLRHGIIIGPQGAECLEASIAKR